MAGQAQPLPDMLKTLARQGLATADRICLALDRRGRPHGAMLVSVLFHSLYEDPSRLADPSLAPNQNVTVAAFRSFVGTMLENGYTAVTPAQVAAGLAPHGRYFATTFDDGYFNNTLALPVLREFDVPATFFVSTDHVLRNKGFWWDAFSRELAARGANAAERRAQNERVKHWSAPRLEAWLREEFGEQALEPRGDLDRPFTPAELRRFAQHPGVQLGNHTCDHAILTRCGAHTAAAQIAGCQQALVDIAGVLPVSIAYPNGNHSPAVVDAALAAGLRVGFTVEPGASALPLADERSRMTLGRFLFHGDRDIRDQCRAFGARFVPSHAVRRVLARGH